MQGGFRRDLITNIVIGLSYILLWAPAVLISVNEKTPGFWKMYLHRSWLNFFVFLLCLLIFQIILPFLKRTAFKVLWITIASFLVLSLLTLGYLNWMKLGMFLQFYPKEEDLPVNGNYLVRIVVYQLYGISYFTVIKLLIHNSRLRYKNQQLELQQKISELNFLKSQTNPHFLFNTLNSIYSLARDRSEKTADTVLRLSDILRYVLFGTESKLTTIDNETTIIDQFIELEKIRYQDSLIVQIEKNIDNPNQEIPPLLLLPIVENAFKHGVSQTIKDPFIFVKIFLSGSILSFKVENSREPLENPEPIKENIGLRNLRRQLELMFADHRLDVESKKSQFIVEMRINLNSYAKN